jgi:ferredoxin
MYPIHGFNPPRSVNRFVKNLPEGLYDCVSLIAVGCNDLWLNDAVSFKLRKILEKKKYSIVVDEILSMPLTLVMAFPKDVKVKTIEVASKRILEISDMIKNDEISNRVVKLKSKLINTIGKLENPASRLFGLELHAKKNCTSCSICWNSCPEYNIKQGKNNKPKFGFSCSMCMRCIYTCPEKAITPYISKFLTIKNGYKLEE